MTDQAAQQIDRLRKDVERLLGTVLTGNGSRSLVTEVALIRERIAAMEKRLDASSSKVWQIVLMFAGPFAGALVAAWIASLK